MSRAVGQSNFWRCSLAASRYGMGRGPLEARGTMGDFASRSSKLKDGPQCKPYAERFVRAVREKCLDHFVSFGEAHLRHLLDAFVQHSNRERYHQGHGGNLVMPNLLVANDNGAVVTLITRSSLGGI